VILQAAEPNDAIGPGTTQVHAVPDAWGESRAAIEAVHAALDMSGPHSRVPADAYARATGISDRESRIRVMFMHASPAGREYLAKRLPFSCHRANARSVACVGIRVLPEVIVVLSAFGAVLARRLLSAVLAVEHRLARLRVGGIQEKRGPPGHLVASTPRQAMAPPRSSSLILTGMVRAA